MSDILLFEIPEAYAQPIKNGISVTLVYPEESKRKYMKTYMPVDNAGREFGISCLERLTHGDRVRIGTPEHPLRPSAGGIIDLLRDGSFFTHRRDGGTKVHPWHYGIPSGNPSAPEHFLDLDTLLRAEGAEESILFTMDDIPWVYLPDDPIGKAITLQRLQYLGIANKTIETKVEYFEGEDILEIMAEKGSRRARFRVDIYLSWGDTVSISSAKTRYWPNIDPANVRANDAEAFVDNEGKRMHLNREVFHLSRNEVEGKRFGDLLEQPNVYRLEHRGEYGVPVLQENPQIPYLFMPDDGLRRMLDSLRIPGWVGQWMHYEIEREKEKLRLINDNVRE